MEDKYTVRLYDRYDHGWCDCFDAINVSLEQAQAVYNKETKNGTVHCDVHDDMYYKIFRADTAMLFEANKY